MTAAAYFSSPKTLRRIHQGPLGPYVDDFASWLREQGYSRSSGRGTVRAVGNWSRWLCWHQVTTKDVDARLLDRWSTQIPAAQIQLGWIALGYPLRPEDKLIVNGG